MPLIPVPQHVVDTALRQSWKDPLDHTSTPMKSQRRIVHANEVGPLRPNLFDYAAISRSAYRCSGGLRYCRRAEQALLDQIAKKYALGRCAWQQRSIQIEDSSNY